MPALVIVFILGIAAFMGWRALRPECAAPAVAIANEADCRANFDALFCLQAMAETERVARASGGSFPTQSACLERFPVCIERSDVSAWTPRPARYCVARAADGGIARIDPVYR
ncbi:MAG: hypothetical protein KGM42_14355 [Hyphomicrobiales bacterium]|nr:hypothetical protein [Hyphomicrobiales bacterium]